MFPAVVAGQLSGEAPVVAVAAAEVGATDGVIVFAACFS